MSGATLKKIAVITMLIDHIAVAFLCIFTSSYDGAADFAGADMVFDIMRIIGRTSFPLFCFMLVEGFFHTRNLRGYLLRLFLFALLSEVSFDLAFFDRIWDVTKQNVLFTLFFGALAMAFLRWGEGGDERKDPGWKRRVILGWLGAVACCLAAHGLRTDYAGHGVVLILVLYMLRGYRIAACVAGYVTMCLLFFEYWSYPAFFLAAEYNGKKGKGFKYFFYVFYPAHLLILAGIRILYL